MSFGPTEMRDEQKFTYKKKKILSNILVIKSENSNFSWF